MSEQKAERLLYLMNQLPDDLLDETVSCQMSAPKSKSWNKAGLVAACFCVYLVGVLVWNRLQDPMQLQPTEAAPTLAGVVTGETSARDPLNPTGETAGKESLDPTKTAAKISEFWYEERLYIATEVLVEELPESYVLLEPLLNGDRLTKDKDLIGANVYCVPEDLTGLYVEEEGRFRYYTRTFE